MAKDSPDIPFVAPNDVAVINSSYMANRYQCDPEPSPVPS